MQRWRLLLLLLSCHQRAPSDLLCHSPCVGDLCGPSCTQLPFEEGAEWSCSLRHFPLPGFLLFVSRLKKTFPSVPLPPSSASTSLPAQPEQAPHVLLLPHLPSPVTTTLALLGLMVLLPVGCGQQHGAAGQEVRGAASSPTRALPCNEDGLPGPRGGLWLAGPRGSPVPLLPHPGTPHSHCTVPRGSHLGWPGVKMTDHHAIPPGALLRCVCVARVTPMTGVSPSVTSHLVSLGRAGRISTSLPCMPRQKTRSSFNVTPDFSFLQSTS